MANRRGSSSGSITDDQLRRSALNRQKAKDKLSKKPGKPSDSDSVHCVCSSKEDVGHMVACESCCRWSHSKCVGLTASIAPSYPFVCPFCVRSLFSRLSVVESEVAVLSTRVSSLESTLNNQGQSLTKDIQAVTDSIRELSSQVDPLLSNMPQSVRFNVCDSNSVGVSVQAVGAQRGVTNDGRLGSPNSPKEDRRHNLIFFGISESPEGTSFRERLKMDYTSIFSAVEPLVASSSSGSLHSAIRTCTRLGRYDSSRRPRPLVVKFNDFSLIPTILRNSNRLPSPVTVRKDLSKEDRYCNSLLLKERFRLITEAGVARDQIRLRGKSLHVNGRLHGIASANGFTISPSLGDLAPSLESLSSVTTAPGVDSTAIPPPVSVCVTDQSSSHAPPSDAAGSTPLVVEPSSN